MVGLFCTILLGLLLLGLVYWPLAIAGVFLALLTTILYELHEIRLLLIARAAPEKPASAVPSPHVQPATPRPAAGPHTAPSLPAARPLTAATDRRA